MARTPGFWDFRNMKKQLRTVLETKGIWKTYGRYGLLKRKPVEFEHEGKEINKLTL